jgi:hypothetical protein
MKYQLVTQHTNLFLVHERAEENKAEGLPKLQQVAQMQAAGFGGYGSVSRATPSLSVMRMSCNSESFEISDSLSTSSLGGDYGRLNTPSVWRTNRTQAASKIDATSSQGMDDVEIPAFLRRQSDSIDPKVEKSTASYRDMQNFEESEVIMAGQLVNMINMVKVWISPNGNKTPPESTHLQTKRTELSVQEASLEDIVKTLNAEALQATSFRIALQQTLKLNMPYGYAQVIIDLTKITKDSATSWALLFEWLIEQSTLEISLEKHAQRLTRAQLTLATQEMKFQAIEIFKKALVNSESHS